VSDAAASVAQLIHREGPIPFDRFMEAALYGEGGFFTSGHGAGRAGRDFITSPEVGSLFGACVAGALDRLWRALDEPDPFLVVEAGAGNGRLAREILRTEPACLGALRYVLVERSPQLRVEQRERLTLEPPDEALGPFARRAGDEQTIPAHDAGPVFVSLDELPALAADDVVVLANELFDNLPFGIAQWDGARFDEVRIGVEDGAFVEMLVPVEIEMPFPIAPGTRLPIPRGLHEWLTACDALVRRGFLLAIDYMTPASELAAHQWLRTYRAHGPGGDPLDAIGEQDITGDVVVEQLEHLAPFPIATTLRQHAWLDALGIEVLVEAGRQAWEEGAQRGDLEALAGRSRVNEARALTDLNGLGAHHVVLFAKGVAGNGFDWRR
jgi:SAM-dependent MidA family methyltransferase